MLHESYKMIRYFYLSLFVFFFHINVTSQTVEPATTVGRNELQIEFESQFSRAEEKTGISHSWILPGFLARYGLSEAIELQIGVSGLYATIRSFEAAASGDYIFQKPEAGIAIQLWKEGNFVNEANVMMRIAFPNELPVTADGYEGALSLNLANRFSDELTFTYNFGLTIMEATKFDSVFFIANLDYAPDSHYHFFLEDIIDFQGANNFSNILLMGGGYNFWKTAILDLSLGKNLTDPSFIIGAIFSYNFDL